MIHKYDVRKELARFLPKTPVYRQTVLICIKVAAWLILSDISIIYDQSIKSVVLLPAVIYFLLVYLIVSSLVDAVVHSILFLYRRKNKRSSQYVDGFTIGVTRLGGLFFVFVFILFVINLIVPISTLFGSLTIAIAVAGLAFRDLVVNLVNGIIIMFSGKFQIGEYLQIGDSRGRIRDLSFSHVELTSESKDSIFIPNSVVLSREVTNFSKSKVKNVLVHVVIGKEHFDRYDELYEYLFARVSAQFPEYITSKKDFAVRVEAIDKDSMSWLVEYHVLRYDFALDTNLKNFTAEVMVDFYNEKLPLFNNGAENVRNYR